MHVRTHTHFSCVLLMQELKCQPKCGKSLYETLVQLYMTKSSSDVKDSRLVSAGSCSGVRGGPDPKRGPTPDVIGSCSPITDHKLSSLMDTVALETHSVVVCDPLRLNIKPSQTAGVCGCPLFFQKLQRLLLSCSFREHGRQPMSTLTSQPKSSG